MAKSSSAASARPPTQARFPVKRTLTVFLILTLGSLGGIFLYSGDHQALMRSLKHLWDNNLVVGLIVGLLVMEWYTDYLRYRYLARGVGVNLPVGFGLKIVFANLFFAYLTPGGAFGAPVIIYMLVKRGESLPNAIAIALIKPFLLFFVLLLGGSVMFLLGDFSMSPGTQRVLWVSSVFVGILTIIVATIIFLPAQARKGSEGLFGYLRRSVHRRGSEQTPRLDRWQQGFETTITAFSMFGNKQAHNLLYSLLATIANLVFFLGISVVLLQALGFPISFKTSWVMSFLYFFLIAFSPTPGGSGLAEGGGYLFFKDLGPAHLVSSYVFLWRFLSCYLVLIIGGFMFFRFIQQLRVDDLKDIQDKQSTPLTNGEPSHVETNP